MKTKIYAISLLFCFFACKNTMENYDEGLANKPESEMKFDKQKWNFKEGKDFPYRDKMLNDVVYNDSIRTLSKSEFLNLLGEPSYYRDNKDFLYYTISQKRLGPWPLHTKSMVIKLTGDDTIEWIKIHK